MRLLEFFASQTTIKVATLPITDSYRHTLHTVCASLGMLSTYVGIITIGRLNFYFSSPIVGKRNSNINSIKMSKFA
jgi:hypothetical protein